MGLISGIYGLSRTRFAISKSQASKIGAQQRTGSAKRKQTKNGAIPPKLQTLEQRRAYYRTVYLRSKHWLSKRKAFLARYGRKCMECASSDHIQVHHVTYERLGRERDVDLRVLCRDCHKRVHGYLN